MATYARVENGTVVETREMATPPPSHKAFLWRPVVVAGEGPAEVVEIGDDVVTISRSTPAAVPQIVSDRQFFQHLAHLGVITPEEALAAVGPGDIPTAMQVMIAELPEADQFPARMLLTGATQFDRTHPLVAVFGAAFDWSSDDLDAFWIAANAL